MSANYDFIVIFQIYSWLRVIRKPDSGRMVYKFLLIDAFLLRYLLTQLLTVVFSNNIISCTQIIHTCIWKYMKVYFWRCSTCTNSWKSFIFLYLVYLLSIFSFYPILASRCIFHFMSTFQLLVTRNQVNQKCC